MKKVITLLTITVILLSTFASLLGVWSYSNLYFQPFTTVRGEHVEILTAGIYQFSVKSLVVGGIPFDAVRLVVGIPLLIVALIFFVRGSLRGTLMLLGALSNFVYQYLLWAFAWAYNPFYLAYVVIYSFSLISVVLIWTTLPIESVRQAIRSTFPVKLTAAFSFLVGVMLAVKCLGEIIPTLVTNTLPTVGTGYYTLIDQGLDLGMLVPLCLTIGILLLKRHLYGYVLAPVSFILFLNLGLSVIMGAVIQGFILGNMPIPGILAFSAVTILGTILLAVVIKNIEPMTVQEAIQAKHA